MRKVLMALCAICAAYVASARAAEQELTYIDLIKRLTDLEFLATLPQKGETCSQWSSWDRASKYDEASGKYVKWDANGDGQGFIRREGNQIVMAEMQGPGCIWRIWSAAPGQGRVKVYLDGAAEPAIDLPFVGYFDGKNAPFTRKGALVHTVARGWNNYIPIPYQKSCRIVAEPKWGNYYHFTYATYPAGTKIPTFKRQLSEEESAALDAADKALAACGDVASVQRPGDQQVRDVKFAVPGGESQSIAKIDGPRAITAIRAKIELPDDPAEKINALRELALKIVWDGEDQPAVWAPLGDFFGTAAGANAYRSLPCGLGPDGWWYSFWYMPFGKSAAIDVVNDGKAARAMQFQIIHAPVSRPIETLGRFHAKWCRDALLPTVPERRIDWPMLITQGRGRFCGVMLHIWNPKGGWWGEGDEKFFVDGEKFPSTFGTGSEDYFGYAWGDPALFQNAYHNQTISMGNKGHVSVNRWHITDNVPFQTSFDGYIEKYFANSRPTLYACMAYWYLAPGGTDPYAPAKIDERVGYWSAVAPSRIQGAIEGESMKILSCSGGKAAQQDLHAFDGSSWSNGAHL